ncbi:MAG: SoxR reducing system RseC family protein [Methyloglobulus sp.]|nr:SoxR reducing system RseC family protein [Methyloglobulus sp.]
MIEELAVVVKIENYQVWVVGGQNSACGGCLQKASCTTNALGSVLKKKSVRVDTDIELKTGDQVMVAIDEAVLLQASLVLYLLPLIALFTSAGVADWLLADNIKYADLWIAASAFSGFLLCLWLINKAQNLMILGYYARPIVVKKI